MTSKDERMAFLAEMQDVRRIRQTNRADVKARRELTPGHIERQRAALALKSKDSNPLTAASVDPLTGHDVICWMRPGVQHGVFKKLRLGYYPIEARLDLHRMTVEEARRDVFSFISDCFRYGLRTVLILHGKGERNPDGIAHLKSYLAKWLPELPEVLAVHSAQKHHGGTGAVYVMVRKGERDKQRNREIHNA
ncbi:DNA endonuclease SmrA [Marinobacter sp. X15-166B]|uniref:DNA endonuclease SmrA n=1 Tax=Marinobacter sp. X15-166B TaxID=1897620 RepID=UPI00085CA9BC|nr:DNA endonuclease SmrA [Marinobacter sp. X15-166B]OEY68121.1 DNA mismatch repair protein MutS [Marinobacter sp. X15-166B]